MALYVTGGTAWFDGVQIGANPPTATFVGANLTGSGISQGWTNLSLSNATANATWQGWTGSAWTNVSSATWTTTGNHTTALSGGYQKWRLRVDVSKTGPSPTASIHDTGIQFSPHAPQASNLDPPDGAKVTSRSQTFNVSVADPDFATAQGDSVNATLFVDGSAHGSQTLTSNGTVSKTAKLVDGGSHTYHWVLTDSYGQSTTTATNTVTAPGTLFIRNETNTSELVDSPINVTVRFFGNNKTYSRSTTTGKLNLTGLPTQDFIVVAKANDNYYARTVYISDLYAQDTIYLLNKNVSAVQSRFDLNDPTGDYPPDSLLIIEKPIEENGTVSYQRLYADKFGVEGVTVWLEKGARYRIKVRAPDSSTSQSIGPYRADVNETVTVQPGSPDIELGNYTNGWAANATIANDTITYAYSDPSKNTSSLTVSVHERNNASNVLTPNQTYSSLGNASGTFALNANQTSKEWVVVFNVTRDGKTFETKKIVSNRESLVPQITPIWRKIIAIGILLISAGVFSQLNAGVGGVVVSLEGGLLFYTGWLSGVASAATVVIALFVSVIGHLMRTSRFG